MKKDIVIFDLDGTLLDTLADLASSVNYALRRHGLPERPTHEIRHFLGNGIRSLMRCAVPEGTDEGLSETAFQTFREHYVQHCMDRTCPYPGIMETLAGLKRRGVRMAIVSNKLQPAVSELSAHFFHDFITIAVGESETVRRKPHPDAVIRAMYDLGGTPQQTLYVGDSEVDIETARRAAVPCVSVTWGFRDEDYLRSLSPDVLIHRPEELLDCLELPLTNEAGQAK